MISLTIFFVVNGLFMPGLVLFAIARNAGSRKKCTRCGYDLRGSYYSPCCPECGTPLSQVPSRLEQTVTFRRQMTQLAVVCFLIPLAFDLVFVLHWFLTK